MSLMNDTHIPVVDSLLGSSREGTDSNGLCVAQNGLRVASRLEVNVPLLLKLVRISAEITCLLARVTILSSAIATYPTLFCLTTILILSSHIAFLENTAASIQ